VLIYCNEKLGTVGIPLCDSLPHPSHSRSQIFSSLLSPAPLHIMSSNLRQLAPDPPSSPDIDPTCLPSSSRDPSSLLSIGDLQTPIPVYQPNSSIANNLWAPSSCGFGIPQGYTNSMQFGGHPAGRPGEFVSCSLILPPCWIITFDLQIVVPGHGTGVGGRDADPRLSELITANHLMQRQILNIDQRLTELMYVWYCKVWLSLTTTTRQGRSYVSTPSVSSVASIHSPVIVPVMPQKSNLELLYDASPGVVMPIPLERDDYPDPKFWLESMWLEWSQREAERGTFTPGVEGAGVNSSWMEDTSGNRVNLEKQRCILNAARKTWGATRHGRVTLGIYSHTPAGTLDYFRARMEMMFLELRLCADHWKTDKLWTENFSSWAKLPQRRTEKASTFRRPQKSTF